VVLLGETAAQKVLSDVLNLLHEPLFIVFKTCQIRVERVFKSLQQAPAGGQVYFG
jgi:hypothetical protein